MKRQLRLTIEWKYPIQSLQWEGQWTLRRKRAVKERMQLHYFQYFWLTVVFWEFWAALWTVNAHAASVFAVKGDTGTLGLPPCVFPRNGRTFAIVCFVHIEPCVNLCVSSLYRVCVCVDKVRMIQRTVCFSALCLSSELIIGVFHYGSFRQQRQERGGDTLAGPLRSCCQKPQLRLPK